jgi:hypothetical protein
MNLNKSRIKAFLQCSSWQGLLLCEIPEKELIGGGMEGIAG